MKQELPQNETKRRNQMETNKKNEQSQNGQQKLLDIPRSLMNRE